MKKLRIIATVAICTSIVVFAQSCETNVKDAAENIEAAEDYALSENAFNGAFDISDDVASTDPRMKKSGSYILPSGAVLNWLDTSFADGDPVEFNIDFGPLGTGALKGMLCNDGKYRAGVMRFVLTKPYTQIGAKLTLSLSDGDNYYIGNGINMFKITGTVDADRTATDIVTINTTNGTITNDAGEKAEFFGTKTITRTVGGSTPGVWGDEYTVEGNGGGKTKKGDVYVWKITKPLRKKMSQGCASTFVTGIIEVKNNKANQTLSVDFDAFGNEACDKSVKVIIGKFEKIIQVK